MQLKSQAPEPLGERGLQLPGRRINYGEARQIEDGDVVSFGDVEVRFKRT